jgi:thioredoxin reductase
MSSSQQADHIDYDVVIVGGGPAGLAAALTLGRARKRTLLCDSGPPRNAAAVQVHNFVTRDGIPPAEFRRIAREQLKQYPNVEARDAWVEAITGQMSAFRVRLTTGTLLVRRVLLCAGMIDELPGIDGFGPLWGKAIFACPYCHAWEVQDRRFAYLAADVDGLDFAFLLRGWTHDLVVLTNRRFDVPGDTRARLASAGISIEEREIARLASTGGHLEAIEFTDGGRLARDVLFARPPQRQIDLVRSLGVAVDEKGYVTVNHNGETSIPGVYAAGDLLTPAQGALLAAASGTHAAGRMNHALTMELALARALA